MDINQKATIGNNIRNLKMISKKYIDILGFRIPKLVFLIMGYVFTLYGLFTGQHKPFYWASPFYCGLGIIAMYYLFDFIEDKIDGDE